MNVVTTVMLLCATGRTSSSMLVVAACGLVFLPLILGCQRETSESNERQSASKRLQTNVSPEVSSYSKKAYRAYREGRYEAALAFTDTVAQINPDLPALYHLRGLIFSRAQRYEDAEKAYRHVLELDPTYRGVWLNLGNNAARQQNYERALKRYHRAHANNPTEKTWLYLGRMYRQLDQVDSAKYAFREVLKRDPNSAQAHYQMAQLFKESGQVQQALKWACKTLQIDSTRAEYHYEVGVLLRRVGRLDEAVRHLEVVATDNPSHYGAHYNLGLAYQQMGAEDKGKRYLNAADSLQTLQAKLDRLESAARSNPDNPVLWAQLADALRKAGKLNRAERAYESALSLAPKSVALQNNLANLALAQGDTADALRRYKSVLQTDSTNADIWLNLGVLYANIGDTGKARALLRRALSLEPGHKMASRYLERIQRR